MSRSTNIGTIVSVLGVIYLVGANTNVKITAPQTNPGLDSLKEEENIHIFVCVN